MKGRAQGVDSSELVSLTIAVPRAQLAIAAPRPLLATNGNCTEVLGITRRVFLSWLPELEAAGVHVIRRGKVRGVLLEDLERWLRARPAPARPGAASDGVDELADELGLRRAGKASR